MGRRTSLVLLLVFAATRAPARAQDTLSTSDTVAYATAVLSVRVQPLASAGVIVRVPVGTPLRLYSCRAGWCRVAAGARTGYALEEYLATQPPRASQPEGRGYINSRGQRVPSPTRTPNDSPPSGATARCRDGTYSFSRSRSGTCSHHGGVAQWL